MESTVTWTTPPPASELSPGALQIWMISLDAFPACLDGLLPCLSPEEIARAERFRLLRDRQHFIVARVTLRLLLSRYLRIPPRSLQLEKGGSEKPYLVEGSRASPMRFNLSHSGGLALLAFARQKELGIDLEQLRPDFASREIAERYFSPSELAELDSLPQNLYHEGFFRCWTRKEAYVKAHGRGMGIPLNSFSVTLTPGKAAELTSHDSSQWSLYSFRPAPGFVAALAAERLQWRLSFYDASNIF
jgi:4'-phosphopantetheinyl transferase